MRSVRLILTFVLTLTACQTETMQYDTLCAPPYPHVYIDPYPSTWSMYAYL